jgi:hypothetical protein
MTIAHYGRALYYPYIHFQSDAWAKLAALHYDQVHRIVPEGFQTLDSPVVRTLRDEVGFIQDIDPGYEAAEVADDFLDFARRELMTPRRRQALANRLGARLPAGERFGVHGRKLAMRLSVELPKLRIASRGSDERRDWFEFEPVAGAVYMTALANRVAQRRGLPIVADDEVFQPFVRAFQSEPPTASRREDKTFQVASLVIKGAVPVDIDALSVSAILKFRDRHERERRRFYDAVAGLAKDIPEIAHPDALHACIERKARQINDAVDNLNASFRDVGIAAVAGLVGLSVPSWASQAAALAGEASIAVISAGLVTVAAGTLLKERLNYGKSRRESPWAYVLSLRDIGEEALASRLAQGNILL